MCKKEESLPQRLNGPTLDTALFTSRQTRNRHDQLFKTEKEDAKKNIVGSAI